MSAATPFEFPRLAPVVHSGKDASPIKLERLTDAELEILSELLEKATDGGAPGSAQVIGAPGRCECERRRVQARRVRTGDE